MPAFTTATASNPNECPLYFTDETEGDWKNKATFDQNTGIATIHANSWVAGDQPWFQFLLKNDQGDFVGWKIIVDVFVDCSTASLSNVRDDSGILSVVETDLAKYGAGVIVHNLFKSN